MRSPDERLSCVLDLEEIHSFLGVGGVQGLRRECASEPVAASLRGLRAAGTGVCVQAGAAGPPRGWIVLTADIREREVVLVDFRASSRAYATTAGRWQRRPRTRGRSLGLPWEGLSRSPATEHLPKGHLCSPWGSTVEGAGGGSAEWGMGWMAPAGMSLGVVWERRITKFTPDTRMTLYLH